MLTEVTAAPALSPKPAGNIAWQGSAHSLTLLRVAPLLRVAT